MNPEGINFFYIYQRLYAQPHNIYSLAWLASPFKLPNGSTITFTWRDEFSFVYEDMPRLLPRLNCRPEESIPCDLPDRNYTIFDMENEQPFFSVPFKDEKLRDLAIEIGQGIQKNKYSIGISKSGSALFMQEALPNTTTIFQLLPSF